MLFLPCNINALPWRCGFLFSPAAKSLQSCPTLCDPIDGNPPGFPIPGILQARTLEWVAISFSNACSLLVLLNYHYVCESSTSSGQWGLH